MLSRTLWLWFFVASLGVTAVLGVMAILLPSIPFEEEMLGTSALLTGYSLLGLVASLAIARGRFVRLAWTALSLLAASLIVWLFLVWFDGVLDWEVEYTIGKFGGTFTVFGVVALHAVLLCMPTFERRTGKIVRTGAIAAATGAGTLVFGLMWEVGFPGGDEWITRFAAALATPAALGTIAVPVLARIEFVSRRDGEEHTIGRHVEMFIRCPRCGHEGAQAANRRGRCPGCGLETTITLAEPRCLCGYLLHGLPEPVCPECGREVDEDKWWWATTADTIGRNNGG